MARIFSYKKKFLDGEQKGYIVSIVTFFVMMIMLSIALSISFLSADRQKNATNNAKSTQSYYAAEAGAEDALYRLKNNPQIAPLSYNLSVSDAAASITIPSIIGGSRFILSQGNSGGMVKNIQAVYSIDSQNISFYYAVSVGRGGLVMGSGSRIMGNVFSDGNISGSGTIDNNVIVSRNGNSITGVYVGGDAMAYSCLSPASVENLTYVTGGNNTCTVRGTTKVQDNEISSQPLPIAQSQIESWKDEASANIISGDVNIINGQTMILGPAKITGSLTISNNATLKMTGTVYVVGDITLGNDSTIRLDNSYSSLGGVILSDGIIAMGNNDTFFGSGQTGSYLLVISTNTSDAAISVSNNSSGAVFYTTDGGLLISNNVSVVEATGYKIIMSNNSEIQYSSGIVNIFFSSGPGGGWKLTSWTEQ